MNPASNPGTTPRGGIELSREEMLKYFSGGSTQYVTDVHGVPWKLTTKHICSNCSAGYGNNPSPPGPMKVCAQCKNAWYCNRECQKKHWRRQHKGECVILKNNKKELLKDSGWKK